MEAFLQKDRGKGTLLQTTARLALTCTTEMLELLRGRTLSNPNDDLSPGDPEYTKQIKGEQKTKRSEVEGKSTKKQKATGGAMDVDGEAPPKTRTRKNRKKSAPEVVDVDSGAKTSSNQMDVDVSVKTSVHSVEGVSDQMDVNEVAREGITSNGDGLTTDGDVLTSDGDGLTSERDGLTSDGDGFTSDGGGVSASNGLGYADPTTDEDDVLGDPRCTLSRSSSSGSLSNLLSFVAFAEVTYNSTAFASRDPPSTRFRDRYVPQCPSLNYLHSYINIQIVLRWHDKERSISLAWGLARDTLLEMQPTTPLAWSLHPRPIPAQPVPSRHYSQFRLLWHTPP